MGDELDGGAGNDLIAGGPGVDGIFGGAGQDVIRAVDGVRDSIDGGPGRDTAHVDPGDWTSSSRSAADRRVRRPRSRGRRTSLPVRDRANKLPGAPGGVYVRRMTRRQGKRGRSAIIAIILAPLAVAAGFLAAPAIGTQADTPTLDAVVGTNDAFDIGLFFPDGRPVRTLTPGTYTVVVHDRSAIHNFHLASNFDPSVDFRTDVDFVGDQSFTVTFRPDTSTSTPASRTGR